MPARCYSSHAMLRGHARDIAPLSSSAPVAARVPTMRRSPEIGEEEEETTLASIEWLASPREASRPDGGEDDERFRGASNNRARSGAGAP